MSVMSIDYSTLPELFNTQLLNSNDTQLFSAIAAQNKYIDPQDLRYPVMPSALPRTFDPRHPDTVPAEVVKNWFYKGDKGKLQPIVSIPLSQSRCGSCWAFSTSSCFGDVIRFNLIQRYGNEKVCHMSPFFRPCYICTGTSGVEAAQTDSSLVQSGHTELYGAEIKGAISPYYTVSFSPKVGLDGKFDMKCNSALDEWKQVIGTKGRAPGNLHNILQPDYPTCTGCQGNLIVCALMLFTGQNQPNLELGGAPLITDFTIHDWACLMGIRKASSGVLFQDFSIGRAYIRGSQVVHGRFIFLRHCQCFYHGGYLGCGRYYLEQWCGFSKRTTISRYQ